MNDETTVRQSGQLLQAMDGKPGGRFPMQELIGRAHTVNRFRRSDIGSALIRERAAQLWLAGIAQAGGFYDSMAFWKTIPAPPPWMETEQAASSVSRRIVLVLPSVPRRALCYLLGVADSRQLPYDRLSESTVIPYWILVYEVPYRGLSATCMPPSYSAVSLREALFLRAQAPLFMNTSCYFLAEGVPHECHQRCPCLVLSDGREHLAKLELPLEEKALASILCARR